MPTGDRPRQRATPHPHKLGSYPYLSQSLRPNRIGDVPLAPPPRPTPVPVLTSHSLPRAVPPDPTRGPTGPHARPHQAPRAAPHAPRTRIARRADAPPGTPRSAGFGQHACRSAWSRYPHAPRSLGARAGPRRQRACGSQTSASTYADAAPRCPPRGRIARTRHEGSGARAARHSYLEKPPGSRLAFEHGRQARRAPHYIYSIATTSQPTPR